MVLLLNRLPLGVRMENDGEVVRKFPSIRRTVKTVTYFGAFSYKKIINIIKMGSVVSMLCLALFPIKTSQKSVGMAAQEIIRKRISLLLLKR